MRQSKTYLSKSLALDKCYRREYLIHDIYKGGWADDTILVCNDYLKYKIQDVKTRRKNTIGYWHGSYCDFRQALKEIIYESIRKPEELQPWYKNSCTKNLAERNVTYSICFKPFLTETIPLKYAAQLCLNGLSSSPLDFALHQALWQYLSTMEYKKYKTKYREAARLLKKMAHRQPSDCPQLFEELLLSIFQFKIKTK